MAWWANVEHDCDVVFGPGETHFFSLMMRLHSPLSIVRRFTWSVRGVVAAIETQQALAQAGEGLRPPCGLFPEGTRG
ncbi:unnamed protein product [Periconia digitata]|uniref:Uncharacterized protein n=1 Tax=Periconia digitata TaxID=1303443 RepID=A0A9W4UDR8_9PLEO|nr:unnamed protein product [Periconia digitata]